MGRGEKSSNATHQRLYFLQSQAVNIDQHNIAQGLRFTETTESYGAWRENMFPLKATVRLDLRKKYRHARMQVQDGWSSKSLRKSDIQVFKWIPLIFQCQLKIAFLLNIFRRQTGTLSLQFANSDSNQVPFQRISIIYVFNKRFGLNLFFWNKYQIHSLDLSYMRSPFI